MSDNIRTALYDADYTAMLASRASDGAAGPVPRGRQALRGGDIVVRDESCLPRSRPGDLLAVPATGAYCRSHGQQLQPRAAAAGDRGPGRLSRASSAGRPRTTCSTRGES